MLSNYSQKPRESKVDEHLTVDLGEVLLGGLGVGLDGGRTLVPVGGADLTVLESGVG